MNRQNLQFLSVALLACAGAEEFHEESILIDTSEQPLIFYDNSCSAAQKTKVQKADRIGFWGAEAASRSVGNNRLYKRWFGTYSAGRASGVQSTLNSVVAKWSLDNGDCNAMPYCPGPLAWVIGTGPIHLCAAGLSLPAALTITSSLSGTLAHERVHAVSDVTDEDNPVCTDGLDTGCFGRKDALNLAALSPTEAVNNADNYELFIVEAYTARVINPAEAILFL
jgi:hypothetical protein